ncbi:MAG: hypothetical protein M3341_13730 [Actinomycetota bacterium]|nr:hypothetical protein [Actinomycetota bacterium]
MILVLVHLRARSVSVLEGDDPLPNEVPCGRALESLPQQHTTNLVAAAVLLAFLTPLLGDGTLLHHAAFFDARAGYLKSYPTLNVLSEVAV